MRWIGTFLLLVLGSAVLARDRVSRPNVLFVVVDDLNDWTTVYDPDNPIKTPNLERLASRGVFFSRAYCVSPACNPSRVATMTGLRPTTTGVYGNKSDWRKALPGVVTIPQHFMAHGYHVTGAGKIFHHHFDSAFHDEGSFHHFLKLARHPMPPRRMNGITNWVGGRGGGPTLPIFDWGPWPPDEKDTPDYKSVDYARNYLGQDQGRPFFLAVGIFRPHSPFFAPKEYFNSYPPGQFKHPPGRENDREDLPRGGHQMLKEGKPFLYRTMVAHKQLSRAIQAYAACATFADAQVGRLLDALDQSAHSGNTIVVLWSDHGFHLGEKQHWEKFALWEKTTRSPVIVAGPGAGKGGRRCEEPVSLLDLYPTLVDLCGLRKKPELEGLSLAPWLRGEVPNRARPVLTTWGRGNHALRSPRWRYIRYADGSEELYDHENDPDDWHNLAADPKPEHEQVMAGLRKWFPAREAPQVADMLSSKEQE